MRIRLAIFDMVGTTVQAGNEVPSSLREAFQPVGVTLSDDAISQIRGRSKRDAISHLLSKHLQGSAETAEQVDLVFTRFQRALRSAYQWNAQAIPGAEDVFGLLRRAQVETVLTTGLDRETAQLLFRALGWESLGLCGLVTGDDVSRGRPAPDLIYSAMSLAGVEDSRSVAVVGDTAFDLDAAGVAKVGWSVGVLSGAHSRSQLEDHPHSVILESIKTLPGWLREVGAL